MEMNVLKRMHSRTDLWDVIGFPSR